MLCDGIGSVIRKKKDGWTVANYRIFRARNGFTVDEKDYYASLEELLAAKRKECGLAKVVPCTRFVSEKLLSTQQQLHPEDAHNVLSEYTTFI